MTIKNHTLHAQNLPYCFKSSGCETPLLHNGLDLQHTIAVYHRYCSGVVVSHSYYHADKVNCVHHPDSEADDLEYL